MARGRPRKFKLETKEVEPEVHEQPKEEVTMPEAEAKQPPQVGVLRTDPNIPPRDTLDVRKNVCPWCNYENDDELKDLVHKKCANQVRISGVKYQCDVCGKQWTKESLGKPWSMELERGAAWVRETRMRQLREA